MCLQSIAACGLCCPVQMTGYCTTWNGEGDAAAGTRQAATEIDFHTDIDEDGVELVSVEEVQQVSSSGSLSLSRKSHLQQPLRSTSVRTLKSLVFCWSF